LVTLSLDISVDLSLSAGRCKPLQLIKHDAAAPVAVKTSQHMIVPELKVAVKGKVSVTVGFPYLSIGVEVRENL
jgi:hypothetical protein